MLPPVLVVLLIPTHLRHLLLKRLLLLKLRSIVVLSESLQRVVHVLHRRVSLTLPTAATISRQHHEFRVDEGLVRAAAGGCRNWVLEGLVDYGRLLFLRLIVKF